MGTLQIGILGSSFAIKANENDVYLKNLLNHFSDITQQVGTGGSVQDPLQISIISGIMICDELYKEKTAQTQHPATLPREQSSEIEQRINRMITKLDQALT
jgi:cell division protein ZapA (FtsZ GTPase activity inhibitor)